MYISASKLLLALSLFSPCLIAQGTALRLGPSTYVEFPHHATMNTGASATIEYWARADTQRGDTIWSRYRGSAEHKALSILGNGSVQYLYAGSPWHQGPGYRGVTLPGPGAVPADGAWHHLALVRRSSGRWSVYVDGQRIVDEGPGTGLGNGCWITCNVINAQTTTTVGNSSSTLESWDLDDLRISTVERYFGNFTPSRDWAPDASTVMLLLFDEGQGSSVQDASASAQMGSFRSSAGSPNWTWVPEAGNGNRATVLSTGSTCPAGSSASLVASGLPVLGTTMGITVVGGAASVPAQAMVGADATFFGIPFPADLTGFGLPGCAAYASPDVLISLSSGPQGATAPIVIPTDPAFIGFIVRVQALLVEPGQGTPTLTNGLILTLGI